MSLIFTSVGFLAIIGLIIILHLKLVSQITQLITKTNERAIHDQLYKVMDYLQKSGKDSRQELSETLKSFDESLRHQFTGLTTHSKNQHDSFATQLSNLTKLNDERMERIRQSVEKQLHLLQEDNTKKLEQMRATVDEKLHSTLEKRLGESFKLVGDRLEKVHLGLGEMQQLASGVGDLKRVLTNVKTRGTWGEVQLETLLEQLLTTEQYEKNVKTKPRSNDMVEFAIKMPGRRDDVDHIWLPIDAKFPMDRYEQLVIASEQSDAAAIELAAKALENQIKVEARRIHEKYINPPLTTDFALLFVPVEGLYAEIMRRPGLYDVLLQRYRVIVSGPSTLSALLNSLQMGFRTLAIEKRSSEVWSLLASVKSEFSKFGDILDRTKKKLQEAGNTIDVAASKTRNIERKLSKVEELPTQIAPQYLEESLFSIDEPST